MTNKSKLTLIIDGNWLLISRMSNMIGKFANEKDMMLETKLLMIKSINVVLRTFPMVDNIMFVSDGGSWRKDEPVPSWCRRLQHHAGRYAQRAQNSCWRRTRQV